MSGGNPPFYAHSDPAASPGDVADWEILFTSDCAALSGGRCDACEGLDRRHGHLNKVAWWTAKFASRLFPPESADAKSSYQWGYLAGLWHDIGKFSPVFQRKLHGERIHIEHAGAGAALAKELLERGWDVLAFTIAGHHSGLPNALARLQADKLTALEERLRRAVNSLAECRRTIEASSDGSIQLFKPTLGPSLPAWTLGTTPTSRSGYSSFVRMIFSALVDADSIATEKFCTPAEKKTLLRHAHCYDDPGTLQQRLDAVLDQIASTCEDTEVNGARLSILRWCRESALQVPGFFTLNVPTGGGKTLASMSFALRHVVAHQGRGMRRVIVAVPYTSIIEQNAGVYSSALGAHNVVEHHSNLDDFEEGEEGDDASIRRRLACENWDAPVIVTTNVQLFESLFAHKRRRSRKLHNIAGSVIILDEAQCVPVGFMQLILTALRELVEHYGCTVVVSTATQPAWRHRRTLPCGIRENLLRPIIPLDAKLSHIPAFDRVAVEWPESSDPVPYEQLAARLADEPCVMAIVHRKKDAQWLARKLEKLKSGEQVFHLSTNMCPAHRRQVLTQIREALKEYRCHGTPCRVISTQLVEAGVDLDLPVIYRALAGLDSIAQAAGRCNREGRMQGCKGRVVVFVAETEPPDGHLKQCADVTRRMLAEHGGTLDLRDPSVFEEFFVRLYRDRNLDAKELARHVVERNFETVGREFRLIEEGDQVPVVIAFDEEAQRRLDMVTKIASYQPEEMAARFALRALQPYTVSVWPKGVAILQPALQPLFPGSTARVLNRELFPGAYDGTFGLVTDDEPTLSAEMLVI